MSESNKNTPIYYLNRYTGKQEREQVLGEKCLTWVYGSTLGKLSLFLLVKRSFFSKFFGWLKNRPQSKKEIIPFIERFGINTGEILLPLDQFKNFNEFFYRQLKQGARPVPEDENAIVFPADARHMGWKDASEIQDVFVKNQQFDLSALLDSKELADLYAKGSIVLSRLCPVDYHRFHFPCDGTPGAPRLISGSLVSVSPYALRKHLSWLWSNKRALTIIETKKLGKVAMLEVGATNMGSIIQTYAPLKTVQRGDEKGYFAFGGSTVMTFFEPGKIQLSPDLLAATARQMELYAHQGDAMGQVVITP